MRKSSGKALYLFLCSLMGVILFGVIHRALVVIYYLMQDSYYFHFQLRLSAGDLQALDFFSMLIALFLGGWYGIWLGMHWYEMVYESDHKPGLFHGFIPHHFRAGERAKRQMHAAPIEMSSRPVHVPVTNKPTFEKISSMKSSLPWELDDLSEPDQIVKRPVRKKTVRKTVKRVRKTEV